MHQSIRTIAIKSHYDFTNYGDDALMVVAFEIGMRAFPSQKIVFLCHDASYIQRILPVAKVILPNFKYRGVVDIVIYGGGIQFHSFPLTGQRWIHYWFERIARNARRPDRLGKR